MNLPEVADLLNRLDEQKLSRAYLQAIKPYRWRPKGFKLRTCFGLAEILSVQDKERSKEVVNPYTTVVFTIEYEKVERWFLRELTAYFNQLKKEDLIVDFKINSDRSIMVKPKQAIDFIMTDVTVDKALVKE